jgi:hypothetical protein
LEITKQFDLSSISWSDQKYEAATTEALSRMPKLKTYLSKIEKDDRYRYEVVKRMITVKAKKQTELATKRRNRPGATPHGIRNHSTHLPQDVISVHSGRSLSPHDSIPLSPKSSPVPTYTYEYRPNDQILPKPFHLGRATLPLSPQSAQSHSADISDIFLAQTQRSTPSYNIDTDL